MSGMSDELSRAAAASRRRVGPAAPPPARARPPPPAAAAIALASCLAVLVALTASAAATTIPSSTTVVLGQTAATPDPACPERPCQAVGSVTGFQVRTSQSLLPFLVRRAGTVEAWTLTLAQPTGKQRAFFNGFFGLPPQARLSILHRVAGTHPPRYSLRRQGRVRFLSPYLGQTVQFGASLRVGRGDIVALTIPTWAPAFAQGLAAANAWRASRASGKCTNPTDIRQGEPQQRAGGQATYGCLYRTARLLYTATIVED
jgi:hypothetical protein